MLLTLAQSRRALVRGTGAAIASTLALMACSRRETGSALAGVNAVSHWAFGDADATRNGFSFRHTAIGAVTQHAASVFWAAVMERFLVPRRRAPSVARLAVDAAATSALACAIDYTITPKRLTPGYELRLTKRSMAAVYAAFAAGLAIGSLLLPPRER
jgi:hypothetical protein